MLLLLVSLQIIKYLYVLLSKQNDAFSKPVLLELLENYYLLLGLIGLNNGYGIGSGSGSGSGGSGQQGACQSPLWEAKKEYEFEYHGRLLTGLPSLSSQYSGVGMRATVKVFAKQADVLVLKVEQPQYVDVNQVLHPKERGADMSYKKEGWNWRNLYLPTLRAVSISKPMFHIKD